MCEAVMYGDKNCKIYPPFNQCVCLCFLYICVSIDLHVCAYACVYLCIHVCMHGEGEYRCVRMSVYMCQWACVDVYMSVYMCLCICLGVCLCEYGCAESFSSYQRTSRAGKHKSKKWWNLRCFTGTFYKIATYGIF